MPSDSDDILDVSSDEAILVEYLDGELSVRDRGIVEERLAKEPAFRETLARLEESWQYLDLLEREDTDKELLETTLETVIVSAERSLDAMEDKSQRRFSWKTLLRGLAVLLFFFFAFHVGVVSAPDKTFLLRVATPIIERLDMYLLVVDEDPEFLRLLTERRVFLSPLPEGEAVDPGNYIPVRSAPIPDVLSMRPSFTELRRRVERIEHFDAVYYNQFYKNHERLKGMSWERQNQLRELHENIERSPGSRDLIRTLQNYYAWQTALQQYEKNELRRDRSMPTELRIDRIAAMKARQDVAHPTLLDPTPALSDLLRKKEENEARKLAEVLGDMDFIERDHVLNFPPHQVISRLLQKLEQLPTSRD